jgi:hypothetical protein
MRSILLALAFAVGAGSLLSGCGPRQKADNTPPPAQGEAGTPERGNKPGDKPDKASSTKQETPPSLPTKLPPPPP